MIYGTVDGGDQVAWIKCVYLTDDWQIVQSVRFRTSFTNTHLPLFTIRRKDFIKYFYENSVEKDGSSYAFAKIFSDLFQK